MMKIETIEVAGFASAMKALRLPFGKEQRSHVDTDGYAFFNKDAKRQEFFSATHVDFNEEDIKLASTLVTRGPQHAKVMRGIVVWAQITAPVYWWCELETYRAGHERLCSESTMHIDCKGLTGEELQKEKAAIPMGKELTKIDMFSYQCLRTIYQQRDGHRLPEWQQFREWIETLPMASEFITLKGGEQCK